MPCSVENLCLNILYIQGVYLRKCRQQKNGKEYCYWQLVESYRTERSSRQRVIANLGELDGPTRCGIKQLVTGNHEHVYQASLLGDELPPQWVEIDPSKVKVERVKQFGGAWLGLQLLERLRLVEFMEKAMNSGKEDIPWPVMASVLVLSRLLDPSSELRIAQHLFERTALSDLLGLPVDKVNDDRLYRALDALLPHTEALEKHLKQQLGELFQIDYDVLLYDVTSTYFEGQALRNQKAKRGYSRDHRGDCKQVCIALIVSKCGMPFAYELFDGNRHDSTTVKEIILSIERKFGAADRVWVMDRGMTSEDNIEFLKARGQHYILGTPKSTLHHYEQQLLDDNWDTVHEGLEVKLCPTEDGQETFILCRSAKRHEKEKAMHDRFTTRMEAGLEKIALSCTKRRQNVVMIAERVGRLKQQFSRAAALFDIKVTEQDGRAQISWTKPETSSDWATLSEGCYILRSNITTWSADELWTAYIQLTQAEAAFRIQKSDLSIRPIWHQKTERVQAHILVCFLAFVLWKTLEQMCVQSGLGCSSRIVVDELSQICTVDVVMSTRSGVKIRRRCVSEPTKHQMILLQRLNLHLPKHLKTAEM